MSCQPVFKVALNRSLQDEAMSTFVKLLQGLSPFKSVYSSGYPDQSGRTWLVTGVSVGGIGFETSRLLLQAGVSKLWIAGRSPDKLDNAIKELRKEFANADVSPLIVDFNDLSSVKPGLQPLLSTATELHGVIHNAGMMATETDRTTKQGYDQQIGVNVIAPFLIQRFLDDLLIATAKNSPANTVRVVWVSSELHLLAPSKIDFSELKPKPGSMIARYGHTKALNVLEAILWGRKHRESGVLSVSLHPGLIRSDLGRDMGGLSKVFVGFISKPSIYGGYTEMYAALSPDLTVQDHSGAYIVPFGSVGSARNDLVKIGSGDDGDKVWQALTDATTAYM
uniref:ARAD1C17754p n=1 Tax=Blastobotrys adeninivorans TaxID=409370 RepID=A0A060T0Q0_BLAAD